MTMGWHARVLSGFLLFTLLLSTGSGLFASDSIYRFSLDNGLKVVLEENHAAPVVALQVWVKIGSADERDEEAGMCHFIEHMIFKGTEKRKVREMAKEIESLGGSINAWTSYDQTVYHVTLASRYGEVGLDILADAVQHSTFDAAELEKEREVILEEIRMGEDDPGRRIFKQTMAALFKKHPYGRPIIGHENTVARITRDQMVSFFRRWYVPNRMVFVAAGDFNRSDMEKKVREVFHGFKPSEERLPPREIEPEPQEAQSVISYGNFKETYLQLAVPITSVTDEETPALDALAHILGGGEASRLVQRVKLEKRLVHSISSSSFTPRDRGAFIIGATLRPENVEKAIEEILKTLDDLSKGGVTAEELYRVKVNVESDLVYDRQTVQGQARKRGFYETVTGDIDFEKEYLRRMAIVEREDIQRVIQKYFKGRRWVVSVLAPTEQKDLFSSNALQGVVRRVVPPVKTLDKTEGPPVFRTVLGNGVRLLVKENRSIPVVSIQAAFLGGVRFETEANNGVNQFIAVMLTKGTQNLTSLQIAKKMERMAGSLSGFSGYNSFGLTATFLSQHFEEAFGLFSEVLRAPSFDKEEMEKRRQSILAALRQQEDDLDRSVFRLFRKTLYEQHPYRMDPLGTLETVQTLTQKDLKEYYDRWAVPDNLVLTVVGDIDTEQVLQAAQNTLGELKGTFSRPPVGQESPPQGIRKAEIYRQKEQAHFVLGFLGPTLDHRDRTALEVLDAALSGQGGRLFYELRDQESLAYALTFMANPNVDPGFIAVYMGTHPDKLEKAIHGVLRILKSVRDDGLAEEEVERAKRYLIGNFEIGLQTNGAQASQMSLDELYGLGFDHVEKYTKAIERVSREDVRRVAREYLRLDAYVLAVLRPPERKQ